MTKNAFLETGSWESSQRGGTPARLGLAALLLCAAVGSVAPSARASGADEVWVLTMAPGGDLFSRFGHNALLVRNRGTGQARVYNFGTFDASDPDLLAKYLARKLDYFLSTSDLSRTLYLYRGRTLWAQHLDLPAAGAERLVAHLRWMEQPANSAYRYDHIRDNCSTRIRDAIDDATGGALRARFAKAGAGTTIRKELDKILGPVAFERWGVSYILGGAVDAPATHWETQFLPRNLRDDLAEVQLTHPDGSVRPLVSASRKLLEGRGEPTSIEQGPLVLLSFLLLLPLVLSVFFAHRQLVRFLAGLTLALWGLAAGVGGALLCFLWWVGFSAGQANGNLLFTSPLHLVFFPLGLLWAFNRLGPRGATVLRALMWFVVCVGGGDLLAHLLGFAQQGHLGLGLVCTLLPAFALASVKPRSVPAPSAARAASSSAPKTNQPAATQATVEPFDVPVVVEQAVAVTAPIDLDLDLEAKANEPVETLKTVEALEPVETLKTVEALEPVETLKTVEAVEPIETLNAVEAVEAVETLKTVEAVEPIETLKTVEPLQTGKTVETPNAVEAPVVARSELDDQAALIALASAQAEAARTGPPPIDDLVFEPPATDTTPTHDEDATRVLVPPTAPSKAPPPLPPAEPAVVLATSAATEDAFEVPLPPLPRREGPHRGPPPLPAEALADCAEVYARLMPHRGTEPLDLPVPLDLAARERTPPP